MKNFSLGMLVFIGCIGQVFGADITGQGFLKTRGGHVKTCAGNEVYLESSSNHWLRHLINYELTRDIVASQERNVMLKKKLGEDYSELQKELNLRSEEAINYYRLHLNANKQSVIGTICDAQGNFEFKNIKNGEYYLATRVEWEVSDEKQGGLVYKLVEVKQKKQKVFLTE